MLNPVLGTAFRWAFVFAVREINKPGKPQPVNAATTALSGQQSILTSDALLPVLVSLQK